MSTVKLGWARLIVNASILTGLIVNANILTGRHEVHTLHKPKRYISSKNHIGNGNNDSNNL